MTSQTINELGNKYGNSFYVFDEAKFITNIQDVRASFERYYNNFNLAYSFKTNYIPRICQLALQYDLLAEVVSEMEYDHALRLGYQTEQIIYNGPVKPREYLYKAFKDGSIVHFDSESEIDILKDYLASGPKKPVRCAVRCNLHLEGEETSRFGINAEDATIDRAYERLFHLNGCEPVGIHCHYQTRSKSLDSFVERTQKMILLVRRIFADRKCEYIDIGGGFFGNMPDELSNQFPFRIPGYEDYARVIGSEMRKNFPEQDIQLIIEPGTMLVADTIKFYCRVSNIKTIRDKTFVVTNGSIHNTKPTGRSKILPGIRTYGLGRSKSNYVKNADITGYTCIDADILAHNYSGEIAVGDFLEFSNVGAYSMMYKPPFIKGQPIILSIKDDQYSVIKNFETIDDIFCTYIF